MSEFRHLVEDEFGSGRGQVLITSHVLSSLGGRTPEEAIAQGAPLRSVWRALCDDLDVPEYRWYGRDSKGVN